MLTEYFIEERQEVINMLRTLFDNETILRNHINAERREAAREERETVYYESVENGDMALSRAAKRLNLSEGQFITRMTAAGYTVPQQASV